MADIDLKSFPFDSMKVLNENSNEMEDDRLYEAQIFRDYFRKFLSNGVYFGPYKNYNENSMKVILDTGLTVKVKTGCGIIEGVDYENESDRLLTLERPASGNRLDRIVVQMNSSLDTRKTKLIVKQGNGTTAAELTRTDNIYEICIAEVLVKNASNITSNDIVDKRFDTTLCGIVNSLISIDGEALYQRFQAYIDSVTAALVRKDQDSTIDGNLIVNSIKDGSNRGLSKNDFTDNYKTKLDNISNVATSQANGLMSSSDKSKLDGIANNANKTEIANNLTTSTSGKALDASQGRLLNIAVGTAQETANNAVTRANNAQTAANNAANAAAAKLPLAGGTLNGNLTMKGNLVPWHDSSSMSVVKIGYSDYPIDIIYTDKLNITSDRGISNPYGPLYNDGESIRSQYIYDENKVTNSPNMYITSNGWFRRTTNTSSKRYKKEIKELTDKNLDPEKLYNLPVKQFKYKKDFQPQEGDARYDNTLIGFIAEDVADIYPIAADYEVDKNGNKIVENWNERYIIPAMLKLIQNQHIELEMLKEKYKFLEGKEN